MLGGPEPTRASPAGCLVGLGGLVLLGYGGLCAYLVWKIQSGATGNDATDSGWLIIQGLGSLAVGVFLLRFGWRMAIKADMRNADDPTKPMIRF